MHILFIEPDTVLAEIYRAALIEAGHSVQHTTNAQNAIHSMDDKVPDLIVVELQLTGHNGVEFLYELRSYPEWKDIPAIVLTSVTHMLPGPEETHTQLGIAAHHYKPQTTLETLLKTIDRLANQSA